MSEAPKVRLVRCPNCENLLPEVTDFSVYQCGGCGAVLRAKNENGDLETFSEKSGEEGALGISRKFERVKNLSDSSEDAGSSSVIVERRGILHDRVESYRSNLENRSGKWAVRDEEDVSCKIDDEQLQKSIPECESEKVLQDEADWRNGEARKAAGPQRGRRIDMNASSSYQLGSNYGYQQPLRSGEDDRAELLRKLDELKEHLSRSCEVIDSPKDPYGDSRDWFPNSTFDRSSMQYPGRGFYPIGHTSSHPQRFGEDPLRSQRLRADPFQPYAPHHPSCSCFHCYNSNQNLVYSVPNNPIFYGHEHPGRFGAHNYDPRIAGSLPMKTQIPKPQRCWPDELNSGVGVQLPRRPPPPGVQLPPSGGQRCFPVAGAAPFLICHNCLELLHLGKRAFLGGRKQMRVKCGACSSIMVFAVANQRLVSVQEHPKKIFASDDNVTRESNHSRDHINRPGTVFSSEDFDNSRYDFHSMDHDQRSLSTGQASSAKSVEARSHHSKSSSISAEDSKVAPPPPVGSPLQDHFDYSAKYGTANRFESGNTSGRSSPEKRVVSKKTASRQTSMKDDVSVATEMDISSNEYANTGSSLESGESSTGDQLNSKKTTGSFLAGIAKKSFKSKQAVNEKRGIVTVNGHLIPDESIKKAERVSGKMNPGHFWYDFRGGFWGVMGGPCLGIIPPFIEEFNYPMPENCAGGNTGVFVNGRELHNKDMQLLCSRGLPPQRDRSYIIEMSGRVLDEGTGKELESLGKLAPTVERMKCGFGMKVPKRLG